MNKLPEINITKLFVGQKFDSFSDLCTVLGIEKPTAKNTKEKIKKQYSHYTDYGVQLGCESSCEIIDKEIAELKGE